MPERTLAERVGILEERVTLLERLPARVSAVEAQLVQLRGEMRDGFLALGGEIQKGRNDMQALRDDMRGLRDDMRAMRAHVDAGDEETRRFTRVLIEDVIARIATIGEARSRKRR